jgi:hypothetical protein
MLSSRVSVAAILAIRQPVQRNFSGSTDYFKQCRRQAWHALRIAARDNGPRRNINEL